MNAAAVNTRWCGDIAEHLRTELVADALTNAVAARDPTPGVIFHADRGCQYTSGDYATLAGELEVTLSTGRTGQCWTTRSPNRSSPR